MNCNPLGKKGVDCGLRFAGCVLRVARCGLRMCGGTDCGMRVVDWGGELKSWNRLFLNYGNIHDRVAGIINSEYDKGQSF